MAQQINTDNMQVVDFASFIDKQINEYSRSVDVLAGKIACLQEIAKLFKEQNMLCIRPKPVEKEEKKK